MRRAWADPQIKEARRASLRAGWAKRRARIAAEKATNPGERT
jgi:hypothetical protein